MYQQYDVEHVRAKFPDCAEFLVERLGLTISARRQYLTYREDHHNKLAKDIDKLGLEDSRTGAVKLQFRDGLLISYRTYHKQHGGNSYTKRQYQRHCRRRQCINDIVCDIRAWGHQDSSNAKSVGGPGLLRVSAVFHDCIY